MAEDGSIDELKHLIRSCPVVDNHAHNILRPHGLKTHEFLTITTEAFGEALEDAPTSLSHIRAARQLRQLYELPTDADWAAILRKRAEILDADAAGLSRKCFEGTQTLLVDDGLDSGENVEAYHWHDTYTRSPCKRIVRIETVAADILSSLNQQNKLPIGVAVADEGACFLAWATFVTAFEQAIAVAIADPEVVGFKSVICYRTGLDIEVRKDIEITEDGLRSFRRHYLPECVPKKFRVEAKGMNDALVISTCKLIAAGYRQNGVTKPLQFHTGLGDNDISLLESNPACLQPLIKAFPTVPIVLLHSSYPYTREAGYLATVYRNAYLDIGEIFPMVSRDGQEKVLRQALELTPTSKLLWSTDGHYFPETFWLANLQGRQALEVVLVDYVKQGDLTLPQAIKVVKDFFFENSNTLYGLGLTLGGDSTTASEETKAVDEAAEEPKVAGITAEPAGSSAGVVGKDYNIDRFKQEVRRQPELKFVFVQWLDYLGLIRNRCIPLHEFSKLLKEGRRISISMGNLGTLQNDHMSPVCNPVGALFVEPDLSLTSFRPMHGLDAGSVMARFVHGDFNPFESCPRASLQAVCDSIYSEYRVEFLVGFEIEVTFCKRTALVPETAFQPLDTLHAWGTLSDEQYTSSLPLMLAITTAIESIGISIQQMHSESGPGQYEFVLPPLPPVQAVDTLYQARQCIMQVAATYNLRATCHPQPFPGIGTAAHAHISFNSSSRSLAETEESFGSSFIASVLDHLPALCAFTLPQAVSYARVVDDGWTGGTWVAWGTQNREVPLRRADKLRWEIRCLDGCANMYLALYAIFAVGQRGVREGTELKIKDCTVNPTKLSDEEKHKLGVVRQLPRSLDDAVEAAEMDAVVEAAMNPGMLKHYLAMKKAEQEMLRKMDEEKRRVWLIERY